MSFGSAVATDIDADATVFVPGTCDCGITDSFSRTLASSWGTSDAGIPWDTTFGGKSVAGGEGILAVPGGANLSAFMLPGGVLADYLVTARITASASTSLFYFVANKVLNDVGVEFRVDGLLTLSSSNESAQTTLAFGADTAFNMHVVVTSATTVNLYVWQVGGNEPASPTLTLTDTTPTYDFLSVSLALELGGIAPGGNPGFEVRVNQLDVVDLDRCTAGGRFDNFNRTVSGHWGSTDYGVPWVNTTDASKIASSCTGAAGRFAASFLSTDGFPGQTERWRASDAAGPWSSGEFTVLIRFTCAPSQVPSSASAAITLVIGDASSHSSNAVLDYEQGVLRLAPNANGSGATDTPFVMSGDGTYFMRWHYNNLVVSELKVWKEGTAEPASYQLSIVPNSFMEALTLFGVDNQYSTPGTFGQNFTHNLDIDYIDFDYPGKPCFNCQQISGFDNFSRAAVAGSWGTPDHGGGAWTHQGTAPGSTLWGLSGYSGYRIDSGASGDGTFTILALLPFSGTEFTMRARWKIDHIPTNANQDRAYTIAFGVTTTQGIAISADCFFTVTSNAAGLYGVGEDLDNDGVIEVGEGDEVPKTNWIANQWYDVRWERTATVSRMRMWPLGSPEPSTWDAEMTSLNPDTMLRAYVSANKQTPIGAPAHSTRVDIDFIDFTTTGSCAGAVVEDVTEPAPEEDTNFQTLATGFGS